MINDKFKAMGVPKINSGEGEPACFVVSTFLQAGLCKYYIIIYGPYSIELYILTAYVWDSYTLGTVQELC